MDYYEEPDYVDKRNALVAKYPAVLGGRDGWPGVGDGWLPIIDDLCRQLVNLEKVPIAVQIKEKFGGLRFYIDNGSKEANDLITIAEGRAEKTCEFCGKPGTLNGQGWLKTTCDGHSN